jgi:hypothetical protein
MATTRDQYVGLNDVVESTRMNVIGELEMEGMTRWTRTMFVLAEVASAGVKTPSSRNCLTLPIRRSEDADGDKRIMGSRRLVGLRWRLETRAVDCGRDWGIDLGSPEPLRRNFWAATLRKASKSWIPCQYEGI